MKKNNNLSLSNTNDYKSEILFDVKEAVNLYIILLIEYCNIIKDKIKYKNCDYFVIIRGLDTLTYVFNFIMIYTKNLDYVCCYTQKAFYYYIEFINQTSEMERLFLRMTSRDAVTYVYKKTIGEINKTFVNSNITLSAHTNEQINIINEHLNLYKNITIKFLKGDYPISSLETFFKQIKNVIIVNDIKSFNNDVDSLFYTIDDYPTFMELLKVNYNIL